MPIYMDVHKVPGVKAKDVAEAHYKDLLHQHEHNCKCMTYWIDEQRETIFCLVEAPQKEAVEAMHRKAHGLIPGKIIEVNNTLVEAFLGRIYDPGEATATADGLKVFEDPSFRILMVTQTIDPVLLHYRLGADKATALLCRHNSIVRQHSRQAGGREVEQEGDGFIISFTSASAAVACALAIREALQDAAPLHFRVGIHAGEPVEQSNVLFGDTLRFATHLCAIAGENTVAISATVKELASKDLLQHDKHLFCSLPHSDEQLLQLLFGTLEAHWQDPHFDMAEYSHAVAMSTSQLYRKTISLTHLSPNALLKEYRLEKARDLMKKQRFSIAQITYEAGFTSASYFTKCFKRKYGLLPMTYLDLLH